MSPDASNPGRILFVASEAVPLAKTGGLADVVGSLPLALKRLGYDVRVVLPLYRCIRESGVDLHRCLEDLEIEITGVWIAADVYWTKTESGLVYYLVDREELFDRPHLYGTDKGPYLDNALRFSFFSKAVFQICQALSFAPDVLHCHDWQTALVPAYLRGGYDQYEHFQKTGTILTIHNLAYQGVFPPQVFSTLGLPESFFSMEGMEFWGNVNYLKAGIQTADYLTTVSPTYSREILSPEQGAGLEGVLAARREDLFGILNGIDEEEWTPTGNPHIAQSYDREHMAGKQACKQALIGEMGLAAAGVVPSPLVGMITRLADQKGVDLLLAAFEEMMGTGLQFVLLGEGELHYRQALEVFVKRYPGQCAITFGYDGSLAQRIQAGCDFLLMPSRYEPCGLNQIHSMRYGTIPVVRATGGLKDTVSAFDPVQGSGTGFLFEPYEAVAMMQAVRDALQVFHGDPGTWEKLRANCMDQCYNWDRSAREYGALYRRLSGGGP